MPEPIGRGQRYIPGLDGLRALAVLAVLAFHLGFGWASGGLLGVGVFFTLSGYLITALLLAEYESNGHFRLRDFWLRRARRLLPAVFAMIVIVTAWVTVLHRAELSTLRGAVLSALGYVNNWWLIFRHISYFDRIGAPSPLGHLWSLSVEEQFYLLWPWLLMLGLRYVGRRTGSYAGLAGITLGLAATSALLMALLYHTGADATRVYDGTDTRAFGLLIGAALAMVWRQGHFTGLGRLTRLKIDLDVFGALALAAIVVLIWRTNEYSPFIYRGGLVLLSVATALAIAAVVVPGTRTGRLLGRQPLRWLGVRSYGIYLWHYPIIVLTTPVVGVQVGLGRACLQVLATLVVSALSWRYVEQPIRRGALKRLFNGRGLKGSRTWIKGWRLLPTTLAVAVVATACVGMSPAPITPAPSHVSTSSASFSSSTSTGSTSTDSSTTDSSTSDSSTSDSSTSSSSTSSSSTTGSASGSSRSSTAPGHAPFPSTALPSALANRPGPATTSCHSVTHIGDSTSEGMVSPDYLANPAQRLDAQYARVGVQTRNIQISGGTSILETADAGQANAYQVAQKLVAGGYNGCWALALGTNDTADVSVGSAENQAQRIDKMMTLLGHQPVLWVNVKTLRTSGPYAEANMQKWNSALLAACSKYPTMRVYDWASVAQNSWFIDDAIHYTSIGYAARAKDISNALASAFPAGGARSSCVVH